MKNKHLTKCLCITLVSAMLSSLPSVILAADEDVLTSEVNSENVDTGSVDEGSQPSTEPEVTPNSAVTPTVAPESEQVADPTPTPEATITPEGGTDPTITPDLTVTPEATVTPDPIITEAPTPTPTPEVTTIPEDVEVTIEDIIERIEVLREIRADSLITLENEGEINAIRALYDALPDDETKAMVANYDQLLIFESDIAAIKANIQSIIDRIEALAQKSSITLDDETEIVDIRTLYDALTDIEKALISEEDYNLLVSFEATITSLKSAEGVSIDSSVAQTSTAVFYTSAVSNLHAGKEFYLNSLSTNYDITFSDDFSTVMDEIETEYKTKMKLTDVSEREGSATTTSEDMLLVRNWQDILAIYVYERGLAGETSFTLDASSKDDLAKIFAELNPVVRDKENITRFSYANRHINYYIRKYNIDKDSRELLQKYVETDCKLLCAIVTDARGFVRQSVGDSVSEERVNVITAAYSLVGKVGYFWGGKSTTIGMDSSWGTAATVTASGSSSSGTVRAYGLDCSGFVTWAVINGYENTNMESEIGEGTSDQWCKANVVTEADAQPGDLVFQNGPESGSNNHVGIICGKTDAGDWIAVHCSSSKNGVTVGEAYSASFRYIRQPSFYPTLEEQAEMENGESLFSDKAVSVSSTLQNAFSTGIQTSTTSAAAASTTSSSAENIDAGSSQSSYTVVDSGSVTLESVLSSLLG